VAKTKKLNRRKFIQVAVSAAVVPVFSCARAKSPWRSLTIEEAKTLEVVCERIIPADQDPGAARAGVVNFIDLQLVGPYKRYRSSYRSGIAGIDQTSQSLFGKRFADLSTEQQDKVLVVLEKDHAPGDTWRQRSSKEFFLLVVSHTMQGFYGDPRHGGNRDAVSWRMLGIPYPPIRGRQHYDLSKSKA
jgi:gluconate 2-dehydrogenase gamma chain